MKDWLHVAFASRTTGYILDVSKRRGMTDKDRASLERTRVARLRADYERLTIGDRIEQGAQLSWIGTELARQVAGRR